MSKKHRNDIYGNLDTEPVNGGVPAIPAATVVILRDGETGVEVLMLHRTSKVHFGGMWVFPGGRIDPEDHSTDGDINRAARNAAARETMEEANLQVRMEDLIQFSHWTPPASSPVRYATWFFATSMQTMQPINVDGHEIQNHEWIQPASALARHARGEIDLAPPTWVTLHQLSLYDSVEDILARFRAKPHKVYKTRIGKRSDGTRVAMWTGDAGYAEINADAKGERHRLVLDESGFVFENTSEEY